MKKMFQRWGMEVVYPKRKDGTQTIVISSRKFFFRESARRHVLSMNKVASVLESGTIYHLVKL